MNVNLLLFILVCNDSIGRHCNPVQHKLFAVLVNFALKKNRLTALLYHCTLFFAFIAFHAVVQ